jgi:branched-chain amino acid transport system permease protein
MLILVFISVIAGSSWNILAGYAGQYSVGHAAYFGIGAYTTMALLQFKHVTPWWGIWAGAFAALVAALIIGSICFRLRGPYFVLASIAMTEILRVSALNLKDITNGAEGILVTEFLRVVGGRNRRLVLEGPFYYRVC